MSTASLPSYVAPSLTTPSYSAEPHESEQRIALAERSYPRPSGIFVKSSKKGDARLRLNAQEDNIELPVYGSQGCVEGTIELSKTEHITSVEAKIEGRLRLNEIAEGGTASAKLCQCTVVLWTRENNYSVCPTSFAFAFRLPTTFTNEGKTYPLPPTFRVKLSGLPGFTASVKYSVSAIIGKPHRVPLVKSSVLTIPSRPHVVTTPFIYYPRTRPAAPIPASLFPACRGFLANEEWQLYVSKIRARNPAVPDITSTLYIPATRIFCISQPIPFYLSLKSPALSLASFLLPTPTSSSLEAKQAMRIQLMRQSTVDVRNTIIAGTKTDMWRVDCIGEALLKHVDDGPSWVSYSGEINIHKNVKVGGFRAAGLNVKDWILFSMTPPNPKRSPFGDLRQTIPIRLTTDPWTGDGTSMRIPSSRSVSWYSVPSLPDDSVVLRSCMTVPRLPPAMDCDTIDQAQRTQLPSEVVQPAGTDSVPQQASTQPGDGTEVHTRKQPEPNIVEVPSDHSQKSPKVPFKEQVVGVAKKTRGTILGKPGLKHEGEQILEGKTSAFTDDP